MLTILRTITHSIGVCMIVFIFGAHAALAQEAYFSIEGLNDPDGDPLTIDVTTSALIGSAETLRFQTFHHSGGVNAAGDAIAGGSADPMLDLTDSGATSVGSNDNGLVLPNRDALLSWPGVAAGGGAITTDPLAVDTFTLTVEPVVPGSASSPAVDVVGPASKLSLSAIDTPGFNPFIRSLKFGTTGPGGTPAAFNNSATLNLTGDLTVGQTGTAVLNIATNNGIVVAGDTTINDGSQINVSDGGMNVRDMIIDGGTFLRTGTGDLDLSPNRVITVQNGGLFAWSGDINGQFLNQGDKRIVVTGVGSVFSHNASNGVGQVRIGSGGIFADSGATVNIEGITMQDNAGQIVIEDAGTSFTAVKNAGHTVRGLLAIRDGATGSVTGPINTAGAAAIRVNAASTLTTQSIDMDGDGTSSILVIGPGGTLTQTGASTLDVGRALGGGTATVEVTQSGTINTGAGGVNVHATGTLNIATNGTFNANGPVSVLGGTLQRGTLATFNIPAGSTLTVNQGGQVTILGDYDLNDGTTVDLSSDGNFNVTTLNVGDGSNGTLLIGAGSALDANTVNINSSGGVSQSGGLLEATTIDHTLGGTHNFTGGTLAVETFDGDLVNQGGTVAPGASPGITTVTGDYSQDSGSTYAVEVAGSGGVAGTDHDQLAVAGSVSLAGTLTVDTFGGYTPTAGDMFTIVTGSSISGTFDTVIGNGFTYDVTYNPTSVVLEATNPLVIGDADGDGDVDLDDFNILAANFGQTGNTGNSFGDFDFDSDTDLDDFNLLAFGFGGCQFGCVPEDIAPLPEPGSLWLAMASGVILTRGRRGSTAA